MLIKRTFFTIVELLVVISIIAVLAGMLIGGLTGSTKAANESATKADILLLQSAIEKYYQENGSYPWAGYTELKNVDQAILATLLGFETFSVKKDTTNIVDAWDEPLFFLDSNSYSASTNTMTMTIGGTNVPYNPNSFQLISRGADGEVAGPGDSVNDDVYNFEKK